MNLGCMKGFESREIHRLLLEGAPEDYVFEQENFKVEIGRLPLLQTWAISCFS